MRFKHEGTRIELIKLGLWKDAHRSPTPISQCTLVQYKRVLRSSSDVQVETKITQEFAYYEDVQGVSTETSR